MASVIPADEDNGQPKDNMSHCSDELCKEMAAVKISYPKTWLTSDKKNPEMVTLLIQPFEDYNIAFKLKLASEYPKSLPEICIISDCLPKTVTNDLQCLLEIKASEMIGKPLIFKLLKEAEEFLLSSNIIFRTCQPADVKTGSKKKQKKAKKVTENIFDQGNKLDHVGNTSKQKKSKKKKRKEFDPHNDDDCDEAGANGYLDDDLFGKTEIGIVNSPISFKTGFIGDGKIDLPIKRPTHFIAIRISNAEIKKGLTDVQKQLVEKEPLLEKGQFSPDIFHVTLCTLGLDTPEQITHCIQTLETIQPVLKSALPVNPLTLHGMSQFYNRAVYTEVKYCEDFVHFLQLLREKLRELGVEIRDEHEQFTPHVTIIKVKRPERRLFGSRNIQPSIYSHVLETVFGEQMVNSLFLCCMDGQRREDGFYVTLHEMHLR